MQPGWLVYVCWRKGNKGSGHASSPGGAAPQQGDAGGSHWRQQGCVLSALSIRSPCCLALPRLRGNALWEILRKISSSSSPSHSSNLALVGLLGAGWPNGSFKPCSSALLCWGLLLCKTSRRGKSVSLSNRHHFIFFFWKLKIDSIWAMHSMVWPYMPGIFSLGLSPGSSRSMAQDYPSDGLNFPTGLTMNAFNSFSGRSG